MNYSHLVAAAFCSAGLLGGGAWAQPVLMERISAPKNIEPKAAARPLLLTLASTHDVRAPTTSSQLKLEDLVGLAICTHPAVSARKAEFKAAEADVQTARWQYFPTPSLMTRNNNNKADSYGITATTTMAIQQPLWAGGRLDAGLEKARSQARSVDLSIAETQHSLAVNVTSVFQGWLQAKGRVDALGASVRFHEEQTRSIRRRIQGGVSAKVDMELVNARLAQARGDLDATQATVRNSLSRLSQLVGRTLGPDSLALPAAESGAQMPVLEDLIAQAEVNYPALRRIDADVDTAQNEVALRRASIWPTISLRAEHNRYDHAASNGVSARTVRDNLLMLNVEYSTGAGLATISNIDASAARAIGLRESRESARRELVNAIVGDYEDYTSGRGRRIDILHTRKSAEDVLASYDRLFVAGKRSWLDVLNAARELTQAEMILADIEAQVAASAYRLTLYGGALDGCRSEGGSKP